MKKQLIEVAKLMYQKGMVNAFEGNLSVLQNNQIYITPSGMCKNFLTKKTICTTDLTGNQIVSSKYKPSSEIKLHTFAYSKRPDAKAVIHAHPPYSTAFAIANKAIETKAYAEMLIFFGKIPLAKYGTPSTDEIYEGVEQYIYDYDVILLANHGIVSLGKDIYDAFFKLESAESIAKTLIISQRIGSSIDIPADKLGELEKLHIKIKSKR